MAFYWVQPTELLVLSVLVLVPVWTGIYSNFEVCMLSHKSLILKKEGYVIDIVIANKIQH